MQLVFALRGDRYLATPAPRRQGRPGGRLPPRQLCREAGEVAIERRHHLRARSGQRAQVAARGCAALHRQPRVGRSLVLDLEADRGRFPRKADAILGALDSADAYAIGLFACELGELEAIDTRSIIVPAFGRGGDGALTVALESRPRRRAPHPGAHRECRAGRDLHRAGLDDEPYRGRRARGVEQRLPGEQRALRQHQAQYQECREGAQQGEHRPLGLDARP